MWAKDKPRNLSCCKSLVYKSSDAINARASDGESSKHVADVIAYTGGTIAGVVPDCVSLKGG